MQEPPIFWMIGYTAMSYTLFINIASWLDTDAWISCGSDLALGDAVTVELADAFVRGASEPAVGSYWAEIVSTRSTTEQTDPERREYGVRRFGADSSDPPEMIERRYLRHRKKRTMAFIHVSDDKTHDSHAAQTFINKTLAWLEEHYVSTSKERFIALHMHSDNAPSHFKSSKTMYYLTTLPERLKSWSVVAQRSFRVVWEFGAPGHGKGVWDGIGAWMKRTVRQDIVDHTSTMPTVLTSDGNILSAAQVYEHLKVGPLHALHTHALFSHALPTHSVRSSQARFQTDEYVSTSLKKTINEVIVCYTPTSEITRPKPDHTYDSMPGMKKTFLFMPLAESVTLQRDFACWCDACMRAWAPGQGSMDTCFRCKDCVSSKLLWKETRIGRTDASGISNAKQRSLNKARELTSQLRSHFERSNQPVWVAVQNRGENDADQ